ncbi:phosphatase PAP2 family protein [Streptomyces sp. P9(2023)]|uniref:phosphatase PAP2 family protein n=1 Tax=Streptomyces sp. P9(2023) TaxID=3064394 RepID=UPI0028F459ED|nr:phosphatase PAP2 family protein [Streptomyces sp. P9(2023)]MDT9692803.1 phosphatase PAP2 family protein [Streptomyces sp. P9(2023)]
MAPYDRLRTDGRAQPLETGTWWYAAVAGEAADSFSARVRKRTRRACLGSVLLMAVVYAGLVLTATGQRWENAVLTGRLTDETLAAAHEANRTLQHITVYSLAVALLVLTAIGMIRRRYALTVAALGTVAVSLFLAEVLKRYLLVRPDLVEAPPHLTQNSFPSGHTTIAMSVMFGLVLVVPYRARGLAVGLCALWATAVGAYTVAAGWHRPSDAIGADLLVLAVACGFLALLARRGKVAPARPRRFPLRTLFVLVPLSLVALGGLGLGSLLLVDSMFVLDPTDPSAPRVAYQAGHALAAGAGAAAALLLLALLRRVDLGACPTPYRLTGTLVTEQAGPFPTEGDHEIS